MINLNDEYILFIGVNDISTYIFNIEKNQFIFFENTNNTYLNFYTIIFLITYIASENKIRQ